MSWWGQFEIEGPVLTGPIRRFAWWPTQLRSGRWVWLRDYRIWIERGVEVCRY